MSREFEKNINEGNNQLRYYKISIKILNDKLNCYVIQKCALSISKILN